VIEMPIDVDKCLAKGGVLDHVVIDAKGLMSKEQCLVIVY
jgi:hypothetical protein